MKVLREFHITNLLELKLEKGHWDEEGDEDPYVKENIRVQIYINGNPFRTCKFLLIVNPHLEKKFETINSIDEVKEILNKDLEYKITPAVLNISPEEEFWAHCSNLQAWVENDYDTHLLDSKLSFPLLKELKRLGDSKAKQVYNEEVMERYAKGSCDVKDLLISKKYFENIPFEQQVSIIKDPKEYEVILTLKKVMGDEFKLGKFFIDDGKITKLRLQENPNVHALPSEIGDLSNLRWLDISLPNLSSLPSTIGNLRSLETLKITDSNLTELPESIGNLNKLDLISISNCKKFESLPDSFGKISSLKDLRIIDSNLTMLPESFGNLSLLEKVEIENGLLEFLPSGITNITNLLFLLLSKNKLSNLPEDIENLINLKSLHLGNNKLEELPLSIGNLPRLESLKLYGNNLRSLPDTMKNLVNLKSLDIRLNKFNHFPEVILKLTSLKYLAIAGNRITHLPEKIKNLFLGVKAR
ncbi:MAG: hypothetical protein P8Y70_01400 [Candidatus Lokiarchaeota archaeon]